MVKIAFVVSEPGKVLYEEIEKVAKLLSGKGFKIESPYYLDEQVDWKSYDLISFNSCYGYYTEYKKFRSFLKKISFLNKKIINPPEAILWNLEKSYLTELDGAGFDILPTIWAKKNESCAFEQEIMQRNWKKFIIKPSISAGSFNTAVFEISNLKEAKKHLQKITTISTAMIQEFIPEIINVGEYSAFFFEKKLSHLILKTPAKGDFRAGLRQGALIKILDKKEYPQLISQAQKLIDYIEYDLAYARIDMIESDKIYVMELELIEPLLYLQFDDGLIEKYANNLANAAHKIS